MRIPFLLAGVAALVATAHAAPATSPEALRDAVKAAFESGSVEQWKANVETGPMSESDHAVFDQTLRRVFSSRPVIESLELGELPADGIDSVLVGGGRKYTLTLTPTGVINLKFRSGKNVNEIALPYAKTAAGVYKLSTLHGENLDWKGDPDRSYFVTVKNTGDAAVTVRVKYNASGVDIDKTYAGVKVKKIELPAQYVSSVEVIRAGDAAGDTTLNIACQGIGDSNELKQVYSSEKLSRAGTILFTRKLPGESAKTPTPAAPAK